jgi:DNA-directed RNA polymerase subunit omega
MTCANFAKTKRWRRNAARPLTFNGAHRQRTTTDVISPRIDKLLDHVDSDYASVIVAAKRARQINSYYHNLGEGTFDEFPPPMVDTRSKNYLTIALEEVAQGKLKYHYR